MSRAKAFNQSDILDKAMQLFWCKGYNGTSVQELVGALGISRSSMYDTFGDKHQLYIAALQHYRNQLAHIMLDMILNSSNIKATIRQIFTFAMQESLADKLRKGCFMVNSAVEAAPHHPDIAALVQHNMQDIEDAFFQAIHKGQEKGDISHKHDARALARFLMNGVNGLRIAAKYGADRKTFEDIIEVNLSVLQD